MSIILDGTNGITTPPVLLESTALASPAITGELEYEGTRLFFTPMNLQRGLIPNMQYYRLDAPFTGLNSTGAQPILGVGVTLQSNMTYKFESTIALRKTAGTASMSMSLAYGGTATINVISYFTQLKYNTSGFTSVPATDSYSVFAQTAAATAIISGQTSANQFYVLFTTGVVSVATGGTFIPQYQLSAAPGGAFTTQIGSDCLIYPVGPSYTNNSIGTWA